MSSVTSCGLTHSVVLACPLVLRFAKLPATGLSVVDQRHPHANNAPGQHDFIRALRVAFRAAKAADGMPVYQYDYPDDNLVDEYDDIRDWDKVRAWQRSPAGAAARAAHAAAAHDAGSASVDDDDASPPISDDDMPPLLDNAADAVDADDADPLNAHDHVLAADDDVLHEARATAARAAGANEVARAHLEAIELDEARRSLEHDRKLRYFFRPGSGRPLPHGKRVTGSDRKPTSEGTSCAPRPRPRTPRRSPREHGTDLRRSARRK